MSAVRHRRSVRARIAFACACLFLVTGATLVTITFGLVDHSLTASPAVVLSKPGTELLARCRQADFAADPNLLIKCKAAFAAGAAQGAKQQGRDTLNQLLTYSLASLGVLTLVAGGIGWAIAGRVLRPLHAVTEAARRASEHNLGDRLNLAGPRDELTELADTFDGMLDRLDAAFASQRRFVANASHELRTPLTVMRTAIDVTLAKPHRGHEQLESMATEVRQAVDSAEQLIDALLTLARSDRGIATREFVDVATAAEDALDATSAELAGLSVRTDLHPAELQGDRVLLERMVANLIQNAARHNVPGGFVTIHADGRAGHVMITVENSGPRIPDDLVPILFEPFRRLKDRIGSDSGVGLGLSIVHSVVSSHDGVVSATARPEGGLRVEVTLPAAAAVTEPPAPSPERPGRRDDSRAAAASGHQA